MTSPTAIQSIVVAPGDAHVTDVSDRGAVSVPIRVARRLDQFAEALSDRLRVPASVSERGVPTAGHGTLVVCRPDVLSHLERAGAGALSWVVAVDVTRGNGLERAETLSLAAVVEVLDYLDWLNASPRPPAIMGRRELAQRIGATVDRRQFQSTRRYARLSREQGDLPALLADYLGAYAAAGLASCEAPAPD